MNLHFHFDEYRFLVYTPFKDDLYINVFVSYLKNEAHCLYFLTKVRISHSYSSSREHNKSIFFVQWRDTEHTV